MGRMGGSQPLFNQRQIFALCFSIICSVAMKIVVSHSLHVKVIVLMTSKQCSSEPCREVVWMVHMRVILSGRLASGLFGNRIQCFV